ncbi:MAG: DUF4831 family protein [Bacteroidales bacterium]|nr:DUF4831 family protein [Bacteroidales bacterium]
MKRTMIAAAAALTLISLQGTVSRAQDPVGSISYALPKTVITLEVEAVREDFHAGPYARFAQKYLGVEARQEDQVSCTVTSITMVPMAEADNDHRYLLSAGKGTPAFLSLTAQGLVSTGDGVSGATTWRFAAPSKGDFSSRGVSSNLTSESAVLYRNVKAGNEYQRVAVQQNMVVEKTPETRAKEAADMIFNLRNKRVQIVTGDTDATYSGEAMSAAIAEISRLEQEYLSMFLGYSEYSEQKMNYEVIPTKENSRGVYVAFRVSDTEGLVSADDVSGKPYVLNVQAQEVSQAQGSGSGSKGQVAYYRIPAICQVKLTDGADILLQSRIPVYQLGIESTFPVGN